MYINYNEALEVEKAVHIVLSKPEKGMNRDTGKEISHACMAAIFQIMPAPTTNSDTSHATVTIVKWDKLYVLFVAMMMTATCILKRWQFEVRNILVKI